MRCSWKVISIGVIALAAGLGVSCADRARSSASETAPASSTPSRGPLFDGMGPHRRAVNTTSALAQRYFDQGLTWAYAFNHDEAVRSFESAAAVDPSLAMAWWGVALCHGPHINNPVMPEERSRLAWEALEKARALSSGASEVEQALIEALGARYAWPAPADRAPLDRAYADAMQRVSARFPNDADVITLYAESLMDLQPWDLWTLDGQPKGRALEIVSLIESALAINPKHPGANHLYIHAVEASPTPERALAAADTLRDLVPASGHLLHMPAHIDIRVGNWEASATANRRAIARDDAYRARHPRQGFYRIYMMHNAQFLAYTCMMLGRSVEAVASAQDAVRTLPPDWVKENAPIIDGYLTVHMDALKRFGKWDELLAMDPPPEYLPYTTAMWRMNRAVALAAKGNIADAEREREKFLEACAKVPAGQLAQINPAERVLAIGRHFLDGEIAYARRDYPAAERELRAAAAIEDTLLYMEPPDWMQPVRHTLGTVLMDAGRFADAEQAYREDLARWRENGWSLMGLALALERQGKAKEAAGIRQRHSKAWASADISAHATCLCAPMTARRDAR